MSSSRARRTSQRLRNMVNFLEFRTDRGVTAKLTMSAGIITIEDASSEDPTDFIKAADCALYRSKNTGRDKISVFDAKIDSIERCK